MIPQIWFNCKHPQKKSPAGGHIPYKICYTTYTNTFTEVIYMENSIADKQMARRVAQLVEAYSSSYNP